MSSHSTASARSGWTSWTARCKAASRPKGCRPAELIVLHDPDAEKSVAIVIFESEEDYKKGDEILGSMPAGNTPGTRTSVTKYNVATRMKS